MKGERSLIKREKERENIMMNNTIINNTTVKAKKSTHSIPFATLRHFLPIAASAGWLLSVLFPQSSFVNGLAVILMVIGFVSALTVCPIKLITLPFWTTVEAYGLGSIFHPLVGLVAAVSIGLPVGIGIMLYAPAAFTIYKWFKKDEEQSDEEKGMCQSVATHNANYVPATNQYYF